MNFSLHFILFSLLSLALVNSAFAVERSFKITPDTFVAEDEQAVFFAITLNCQKENCPESIELIQWKDANRQQSKARWNIEDKGTFGDKLSDDGIYSRQAYFKEHSSKTLYFTAYKTLNAEVKVVTRPTFIQEMKKIIEKIKASFN
ncbi:MAG: hypothetical protein COX62_02880 [Deltaproteobacteria bacterium CG_4_10_14_0_2_um_filter_43_8]|nr:MAG: hypothetical protein COV43_02050 [Deltaproteobacteria bacterium CG11_big_fil_rev_8_21_14_0_20_42_23]PJA21255.1 MAG: hypothetical protein COX62_02880 [Deltaproteobacteria bacterium CG_4_10_14_0_2_um_filter_43_8]PJC64207.1 MAG: hypothetical protein CO021_05450 [Deltaproteobacteria bacterium CG_4_9_14_0_2_um_filter_42_21]